MKSIIVLLASTFLFFESNAQTKEASATLSQQAEKMGTAFINGDYSTFANFTYPAIVKAMGGVGKMKETLAQSIEEMHSKGVTFKSITFDEPSKIVKSGSELQSTILQHTEMKLLKGRLVNTTTLIAISSDNGKHWTFIDTSNKDIATLRRALPNLSPSINIPAPRPPVRYDD